MSYADHSRRRSPILVAAVGGLHVLIGYALLSGLAYNVVKHFQEPPIIYPVPTEPPPPRPRPLPEKHVRQVLPAPDQPTSVPERASIDIERPIIPTISIDPVGGESGAGLLPEPTLPRVSQARAPVPAPDRMRWITTQDYPTAALRQEVEGVVVISALIRTDGRVRSCLVTQSSGSQLLDDTTCRLYTARARFTPARDDDGNPTTAQRTDRFRWQIPNE